MTVLAHYSDRRLGRKLVDRVIRLAEEASFVLGRPPVFMEVCGTHTAAFSRTGLRHLLEGHLELQSGPGCPVCVTSSGDIDAMIALAKLPRVTVATFGDMMRVPGSRGSLEQARAGGASVRVVSSPREAEALAAQQPERQVVFLGIGFETTAPAVALSLVRARSGAVKNYSVYSAHKLVPPVLDALLSGRKVGLDGLLLPGHVAAVTGRAALDFVARRHRVPAVVAGFLPVDLAGGLYSLLEMVLSGCHCVINGYRRLVRENGNRRARDVINASFVPGPARWRGMGLIEDSGLAISSSLREYDAENRWNLPTIPGSDDESCRCGDVLKGLIRPPDCPLFDSVCRPGSPAGPCMVSSEGACGAFHRYERRRSS